MTKVHIRKKLIAALMMSAMGVTLGGTSFAADRSDATTGSRHEYSTSEKAVSKAPASTNAMDLRASKVIGMKVRNSADENLGKIDDLIVDVNNERVAYAVLSFGGALGIGDKLFAYPVSLLAPTNDGKELVLDVEKERLKQAPGFERKNWPEWNKDSYRADVDRFFGPTVTPKMMPNQRLARASDLIGKKVDDRNGKHAGKIEDLVVNFGNSKVHYAVLDFDKSWSTNDKLMPMSLKSFTIPDQTRKDLVLNVDKSQLDMSQGFASKSWPNINDVAFQRDVDDYLGRQSSRSGMAGPSREPKD